MIEADPDTSAGTCQLNDTLRTTGIGGAVVMTAGVAALRADEREQVLAAVRQFVDFTPDNDPYGEHDCAVVQVGEHRIMWKIDYYDQTMATLSTDPADPVATRRVLTIMLAGEY
ncbi:DUF3768 domain-containing protein [Devosia sp. XGJD_8]|uniref:DUF3768 domain-containing protein n=1 Tax=Devosia sp. XGJD_8 TaxID=3391187 RepID=UPI00398511A8